MKDQILSIGIVLSVALLSIAGFVGYVLNLAKLVGADGLGEIALRVLGAFIPVIGAVTGYF